MPSPTTRKPKARKTAKVKTSSLLLSLGFTARRGVGGTEFGGLDLAGSQNETGQNSAAAKRSSTAQDSLVRGEHDRPAEQPDVETQNHVQVCTEEEEE